MPNVVLDLAKLAAKRKKQERKQRQLEKTERAKITRRAIEQSGITYTSLAHELGVSRGALRNSITDGLTEEYMLRVVRALERRGHELLKFTSVYLPAEAPPQRGRRPASRVVPQRRRANR